ARRAARTHVAGVHARRAARLLALVAVGGDRRGARSDRGVPAMRFLFVVPPLTGHTNPTVSVARALEARGHEVAWVGHPGKVRPLLPAGARLFALPEQIAAEHAQEVTDKARTARGAAALKFLWEDFLVPLARQMVPGVDAAAAES